MSLLGPHLGSRRPLRTLIVLAALLVPSAALASASTGNDGHARASHVSHHARSCSRHARRHHHRSRCARVHRRYRRCRHAAHRCRAAARRHHRHRVASRAQTERGSTTKSHKHQSSESTTTTTTTTTTTSASSGTQTPPSSTPAPALTITGTTYYVSPTGSDSNSGTSPTAPWRTVKRVNEASLSPGEGVLFEGGATYADTTLMPPAGGSEADPVIYGSYGIGNAVLPHGIWFKGHDHLGFEHLTVSGEGNIQGTGNGITVEWCTVENNDLVGLNGMGNDWVIDDNSIDHTGNSGMLLEGEGDTVSGNTITNTGLDPAITYGKHGIYLKVANAIVSDNTIRNFSSDGISARYRNSTIYANTITDGPIGIAWFQRDTIAGTSHWTENVILRTTDAGIYVSKEDAAGPTTESFVIEHNTIEPAAGVYMDLQPTSGTYVVQENTLS